MIFTRSHSLKLSSSKTQIRISFLENAISQNELFNTQKNIT